ncbi:MAG TPA: L-serine ammonia-lyase, iron-sulfur-dependent, subunit alpha [Anaerovoracaceae bacterium]|nr:L-serine ammonia-lyase, iron-sulfur-dependent, subunit alpha [Anaerovoracaceae bacterium]
MYHSCRQLLEMAEAQKVPIHEIVIENEMKNGDISRAEVTEKMKERYGIMYASAERALEQPLTTEGGLITGIASTQYRYSQSGDTLCGKFINTVMAKALSCSEVNASMGKICAMPTAGSCGIVPAVLISVGEEYHKTEEEIIAALITASGIGTVVVENATVAGSEGGCQAECGVAAAMAAAGAVELKGGTPAMSMEAFSLALINIMGLVCDPVAGLVQIPCAQRNASQAVNALLSADLALGGAKFPIPTDEVIDAMYKVGKLLPVQLRETAMGGIAATETAKAIAEKIFSC